MSLSGLDVHVGDLVVVTRRMEDQYRVNTNTRFTINPDDILEVTRVYHATLQVRTVDTREIRNTTYPHSWVNKRISFNIERSNLRFHDPDYVPPKVRKLGMKPDDTEELTYIDVSDPGIQWLFDDMGKFATDNGYCSQYDALCVKLGIPGRPREFKVVRQVAGIDITAHVLARSQREANDLVKAALEGHAPEGPSTSDPEPTPPAPDFALSA